MSKKVLFLNIIYSQFIQIDCILSRCDVYVNEFNHVFANFEYELVRRDLALEFRKIQNLFHIKCYTNSFDVSGEAVIDKIEIENKLNENVGKYYECRYNYITSSNDPVLKAIRNQHSPKLNELAQIINKSE